MQSRRQGNRKDISPKGAVQTRNLNNGRWWIWGSLLIAAAASIYGFALNPQGGSANSLNSFLSKSTSRLGQIESASAGIPVRNHIERPLSGTEFGQFPPYTEAECELEKMLRRKDEDIDLALANWLIVANIPQFTEMTRNRYLMQLDAMMVQVREEMAKMQQVAVARGKNLKDPETRCGIFCNAIIKLGFAYREEFRQDNLTPVMMKELHSDANNTFLAGLLRTRKGTCISMPLIYLVIGQRLGMPVHLVAVGRHYFIRWEEPDYHMNIETTIVDKVTVTPDDSVYIEAEGIPREQLSGSDLRNLTNREVVGELFFTRAAYWATKGPQTKTQQCLDLSCARHLAPDDPGIRLTYEAIFKSYGIKPEHKSIEISPKT